MNTTLSSVKPVQLPDVLKFTTIHLYVIVAVFVVLDVSVPWVLHWIHPMAGPALLPMYFFILLAGLLFGWRAGLLVGILTPLISYGVSGMPLPAVLPRIAIEATCYGFAAGLFRERFGLTVILSTFGAAVFGRVVAAGALFVVHGGVTDGSMEVWKAIELGWPGIMIQILLLPFFVNATERLFVHTDQHDTE